MSSKKNLILIIILCFSSSVAYPDDACFSKCQTPAIGEQAKAASQTEEKNCNEQIANEKYCGDFRSVLQKSHQLLASWSCFKSCSSKAKQSACADSIKKADAAYAQAKLCTPVDFGKSQPQKAFLSCFNAFEENYNAFETSCLDKAPPSNISIGSKSAPPPVVSQPTLEITDGDFNVEVIGEYRCTIERIKSPTTKVPEPVYGYFSFYRFSQPVKVGEDTILGIGGHWNWNGSPSEDSDNWLQMFVAKITDNGGEENFRLIGADTSRYLREDKKLFPRREGNEVNPTWFQKLVVNKASPEHSKHEQIDGDLIKSNVVDRSVFGDPVTESTKCAVTPVKKMVDISVFGVGIFKEIAKDKSVK
jgi:hypothetical protein